MIVGLTIAICLFVLSTLIILTAYFYFKDDKLPDNQVCIP